jgi:hypothetical protein
MNGIWLGLWSLLSGGRQRPRHSPGTARHRRRPQLETLEDRLVLSAALAHDLPGVLGVTILPRRGHLFVPKVFDFHGGTLTISRGFSQVFQKVNPHDLVILAVPDLSNVTFELLGDDGPHIRLEIHNQVYANNGTATFDGLWYESQMGDGALVFGHLARDRQGIHITLTWAGNHFLDGHITAQGVVWHLDGTGFLDDVRGTGHIAGNGV